MRTVLLTGVISGAELAKLRHAVAEAGIDAEITTLDSDRSWKHESLPQLGPVKIHEPESLPGKPRCWTGKRNYD